MNKNAFGNKADGDFDVLTLVALYLLQTFRNNLNKVRQWTYAGGLVAVIYGVEISVS